MEEVKMKICIFCLAFILSSALGNQPMNELVTQHCTVNVSESSVKQFNESLDDGKKVIIFQIHYDSKEAENLTKPIPDDHFADPKEFMWLYDGESGLPVYMYTPYDFNMFSLFILDEDIMTLKMNMNVSGSCNENIVSREQFLRLVFHQLIQIVSTATLPKKSSAYICYDINNRKNISESEFRDAQNIGYNRQILLRYCCKVKDYQRGYNDSNNLCKGEPISQNTATNLITIVGSILFIFSPLAIGFISKAKLNHNPQRIALVDSESPSFEGSDEFLPPFETESSWLSENDPYYSFLIFVKWLFLFEKRSIFASRIRRFLAVILSLLVIFSDLLLGYFKMKEKLRSYLDNNIPLGYRAMMFGYKKSAENTGYFLGGPFVWFPAFVISGMILIICPERFCQTLADSTLKQPETFTFLVQDIQMLVRYGNLNISNIHDYDLLYAILKSSLLTALNPTFWFAVIKQWYDRFRRVYDHFDDPRVIYQLAVVCVGIPFAFISCFLCVCELLLCIVYYGFPLLQIIKSIPLSYTQQYFWPLYRKQGFIWKILGITFFLAFWPFFCFLIIFNLEVFVVTFYLLDSYIIYIIIALISKPDAMIYVILFSVFVYFLVSIGDSISDTYLSLQKLSIILAEKVNGQFVYIRLKERFIYRELFKRIAQKHHPIRYEIAKALMKLSLGAYILVSCVHVFQSISMNMSAYVKIGLLIFTTMIPKIMSILKGTITESRWKVLPILETIHVFQQEINIP